MRRQNSFLPISRLSGSAEMSVGIPQKTGLVHQSMHKKHPNSELSQNSCPSVGRRKISLPSVPEAAHICRTVQTLVGFSSF